MASQDSNSRRGYLGRCVTFVNSSHTMEGIMIKVKLPEANLPTPPPF